MKRSFFMLGLICMLSCEEKGLGPETAFTRIYDDRNYDIDYRPMDLVQTSDGFLILAARDLTSTDFAGIQLVKVDEKGYFEADYLFPENVVAPAASFMGIDSVYYFLAMNENTLGTQLISIADGDSLITDNINVVDVAGTYPLAASLSSSGDQIVILGYDPFNTNSVISILNTDGSTAQTAAYSIGPGSDVEAAILNHYLNPDEKLLSFFCGELSNGQVYFNGFYNYNLSLVFSDFGDAPAGVVQGQFTNGGIRGILPHAGGAFSVAGYQYDDNFLLADAALNTGGTTSIVDLYTENVAELRAYTPMKCISYTVGTVAYSVFAAETESRQIALYFFDPLTGELAGTRAIGYVNPFTLASLKVDAENHLLVLGTTYVAGRFQRIYLNRIAEEQVSDWLN